VSRTSACAKRNRSAPTSEDQTCREGRVQAVQDVVLGDAGDAGQGLEVEVAADDGGGAEQPDGLVGKPVHATGQDVVDGGGRMRLGEQRAEVAPVLEQPGVLHEEERVAVRARPERLGLHGRGSGRRDRPDHLGGLVGSEARQRDPLRVAPGEAVGDRRECPGRLRLVTPRRHHRESSLACGLEEQAQDAQGRGVGPVQVVQDHQHGPVGTGIEQRPADVVPRPEPRALVLGPGLHRQP
jgi:hypothetical protein